MHVGEKRKTTGHLLFRSPANGFGDVTIFRNGNLGRMPVMAVDVDFPLSN
jgi:hypothetical protein